MKIEQAMQRLKEHKILFAHDHGWDKPTIQALDKAIASLECIDEIIELIKNSSDKQYRNNGHWIYIGDKKGLADVLDIINKHLGE